VRAVGGGPPVALSIAGSDSGAGAGIQADLKTMGALGVLGVTAITAVTAQNTVEVRDVHYIPVAVVNAQIDAVIDDLPVAAVKTGMLGSAEVVDPVMVAATGRILLAEGGIDAYRSLLLPHALIVTPNLWEAAILAGVEPATVRDVDDMIELARRIHEFGPTWVLVKGGHLPGVASGDSEPTPDGVADILFDGRHATVLTGSHIDTPNTHGTGCSLSSAVAAYLAHGHEVPTAVASAKEFVHGALTGGAAWRLGRGHGPLDHLGWSGDVGPDPGRQSGRVFRPGHFPPMSQDPSAGAGSGTPPRLSDVGSAIEEHCDG
jgi:hydroxymethylpyrimidine/phosphomethylpyrimidine kinase